MKNKFKELNNLKLVSNFYISESVGSDNHDLFFKCGKFKKAKTILNKWFFKYGINVQLSQNGEIHKIFQTEDIVVLLKVDGINSFLLNL